MRVVDADVRASATERLWHDARVPFALALALGGGVAGAAYAGPVALLAVVVLAQAALVAGWHLSRHVPDAAPGRGGLFLSLAAGVSVAVLLVVRDGAPALLPATGVLGAAVVALFVHQLLRRDRSHVIVSLGATSTLMVIATLPAVYLPAADGEGAAAVVAVAALAAAAARSADVAMMTAWVWWVFGLLAAAVVGVTGAALTTVSAGEGILVTLASGVASHLASLLSHSVNRPASLLAAALPISVAGPVAYVAGRVLAG